MKHALTLLCCLAIAQCGLSPAWADAVDLPDAPPPAVEPGGPDASDLATSAPIGSDLAMLYHVPTSPDSAILTGGAGVPPAISLQAATGADTRVGVDISAANAASQGWPWYGKAALIAGCVLVAGLSAWAIVEATQSGGNSSRDDSSHHTTLTMHDGNTVTIHYGSTETSGGPGPGGPR